MNASIGTSSKTEAISISMQRADDDIFIFAWTTEGGEEEGEGEKREKEGGRERKRGITCNSLYRIFRMMC